MSKFVPIYDLSNLTEQQKQDYVSAVCGHLEIPKELNLVRLIWSDEGDGARRQVAYVLKGATDIIREKRKITTESLTSQIIQGSVVFMATGKDSTGRQEIAVGSAFIDGIKGKGLDNAIMISQTRATRRMTLQFVGGGVLDESEIISATTNIASQSTPLSQLTLAPPPSVTPSSEPGKDITPIIVPEVIKAGNELGTALAASVTLLITAVEEAEKQEQFEARQAELRAAAIAQLNQNLPKEGVLLQEITPKKRRGRKPKAKVDLGPSEPVPTQTAPISVQVQPIIAPEPLPVPITTPPAVSVPPSAPVAPTAPPAPSRPRLTPDQVKPFRQRLFRLVNDQLEPAGFTPKEGMGNADKMRTLAAIQFPSVQNMNDLTEIQWNEYLTLLEQKIQKEGPANTVKYIEDVIGL